MSSSAFCPQYLLSFNKQLKMGREIADWPSPCKLTVLNINSDGSRRGTGTPLRVSNNEGSSSNQDKVIALFRQIQSSIPEEEPLNKGRNPSSSKYKTRSKFADSRLQMDEDISNEIERQQEIEKKLPSTDFKLSRLPSNFVKRSPIPAPSSPRGNVPEPMRDILTERIEDTMWPRVGDLKLPELKELAKARGFKGYSRMKKSDLIRLLRS